MADRFSNIGGDNHFMKVKGDSTSTPINYNSTESFSLAAGGLRLRNVATASLPSSPPEGLVAYDTDDNVPKFYNGTDWQSLLGAASSSLQDWTPTFLDNSKDTGEGQTYFSRYGKHLKFGPLNWISCEVQMTSIGTLSGSVCYIGGLPETATTASSGLVVHSATGLTVTAGESLLAQTTAGSDELTLRIWNATTGTANLSIGEVTNSVTVSLSGIYI